MTAETKSCTAVPNKPMTRAKKDEILLAEEELGLREIARALVKEMTVTRIGYQDIDAPQEGHE